MNFDIKKADERNSGIELLKLIAILCIIASHIVKTLCEPNSYVEYHDYILSYSAATADISHIIMSLMRYGGALGNAIFFLCSAWFLCGSDKMSKRKMFSMMADIWVVSVIILVITVVVRGGVSKGLAVKSLFPTLFENNWYMTCYIIFYLMHPFLNKVIRSMSQTAHLRAVLIMVFMYIIVSFVKAGAFFSSTLSLWLTMYFTVAYIKRYMSKMFGNTALNSGVLIFSITANWGLVLLTNYIGLKTGKMNLLIWNRNCNPFLVLTAVSALGIALSTKFKSRFVNRLSGLSMLIYIIHQNIILRTYSRPFVLQYIYERFGYENILFWVFALIVLTFIFSAAAAFVYDRLLRKPVMLISTKLYDKASEIYRGIEAFIIGIE